MYVKANHLGNVRAVISKDGNGDAETISYTDYYPHGGVMPGRNYVNSLNFPFAYQGQEKDAETNLLNFELRQYDARLGRWYNPDPMHQHHSPYLAMGNNPITMIDPDGGQDVNGGVNIDPTQGSDGAQIGGIPPLQDNTWVYTNPADRRAIQSALGTSYEAQQKERIIGNASLGGYKDKSGAVYTFDGNGNFSKTWVDPNFSKREHLADGMVRSTYNVYIQTINIGHDDSQMPSWFDGMVKKLRRLDNFIDHSRDGGEDFYTQRPPIKTWFWGQVPYGPGNDRNVHMTSVNATNTTNQNPGSLLLRTGKTEMKWTYELKSIKVYDVLSKAGDFIDGVQYFNDATGWDPFKNRDTVVKEPFGNGDTMYLTYPNRESRMQNKPSQIKVNDGYIPIR